MPIICTPEELMGYKNSWDYSVMWEDPIVAEIHCAREKIAAECNYDIGAFFVGLRKRQAATLLQRGSAEPTVEADRGRSTISTDATSSEAAPASLRYRFLDPLRRLSP